MKKNILNAVGIAIVAMAAFAFTLSETAYKIDVKQSTVAWLGKKVTGQHDGNIKVSSGTVTLKDGKLAGGKLDIDMTSMTCNDLKDAEHNQKLIGHLKSDDFFSVDKFPKASFVITKVESKGAGAYSVTGNLTIKGNTNPITFPVTATTAGSTVTVKGKAIVNRAKFDVRYGSGSFFENLGDKAIYDDFELDFSIVATK